MEFSQNLQRKPKGAIRDSLNLLRNVSRDELLIANAAEMQLLVTRLESDEFRKSAMAFLKSKL